MARRLRLHLTMETDAREAAREAGLRYANDAGPGIRRRRAGRGFAYVGPGGRTMTDQTELGRIRSLAVPPAWADVWISPDGLGHLQATGRDARGRKQYRYHARWREVRDTDKFGRLAGFARALPSIRRQIARDMRTPGLTREKVLGSVLALLGTGLIRVGNEEYARANKSFGLTTFRSRHASVRGSSVRFRFRGKSGKEHEIEIVDERLAHVVRRSQELPGQDLFQYVGEDGEPRSVGSADVNGRIREISGGDFTAKDFRTWVGTVLMARALGRRSPQHSGTRGWKRAVTRSVKEVAAELGNTPAVARKSYIHPAILDAYESGSLERLLSSARGPRIPRAGLSREERAVLRVIEAATSSDGLGGYDRELKALAAPDDDRGQRSPDALRGEKALKSGERRKRGAVEERESVAGAEASAVGG